jgi:outer membrane receptor protein involved in Fe transport
MNTHPKYPATLRLLTGLVALAVAGSAQLSADEAPLPTTNSTTTTTTTTTTTSDSSSSAAVQLDPFTVTTSKDKGYAATNEISGSRVDSAIKDIPIPIQVITSEFISDIGATNLRDSLAYSGVMLNTQNDLENSGGTYGSPYGPGGVNNPQGLTSNINQVQLKIRGFVTTNTLRDGFLRGSSTDSINIDRIEVVSGPNALLYGTGNFGGVVDYLIKTPQDQQQGALTLSVGTYDFLRGALDVTGPISASAHLDYRIAASWENSETNIDYQKNKHFFIAPSIEWRPFSGTAVLVDTEYGYSTQNGYSFQAFRAVEGGGATPINNDQIEAVSFYFPPGANPRTFNLSGPDTYNNQAESNVELKLTQQILKETEYLPSVNVLFGYNHSHWSVQTQNLNGEINGPILAGNPGSNLAETINTTITANSIDGQGNDNGNLVYGALPAAVDEYTWNRNHSSTSRDQERAELTAKKSLFEGKWYSLEDQVLAGYSELKNDIEGANWETNPGQYAYKSPNDLSPIRYGHQGDGSPDPGMFNNDYNNENLGWDAGYYLNDYAKLFNDRIILMSGVRRDKNDNWSTDTQVTAYGATPTTTMGRSSTVFAKSYQNGVIVEITKHLSVYGLKAEGIEPNFGGLHNAVTGSPVGSDYAKSRELGVKFDFLDGKISGTISHYKITKTSWVAEPWYAPAPLGHPRFDPTKDIVYELSGGFNAVGQPGAVGTFPGIGSQGAPVQNQPQVVAAWNAAVTAGAVYTIPGETGRLYLDASKPTGAAYLDAAFAANQASGGAWPGWLYQGDSNEDPNINNATEDAGGFYNGSQDPAWQVIDQSKGWDGQLFYTPNEHLQFVLHANVDSAVNRLNLGQWAQYPYPQDRWAVWYFQNGGFGLDGQPLNVAYTNPANTATRTNAGVFPGDDTPKYQYDFWMNYKFGDYFKGLSVGLGGDWHSQEEFFSGVTHGGQNIEQNAAGQPIVAYSPSQLTVNCMVKYEFRSYGHSQYVQLNVDNLLDDRKLYGLVYNTPLQAKISYGIGF